MSSSISLCSPDSSLPFFPCGRRNLSSYWIFLSTFPPCVFPILVCPAISIRLMLIVVATPFPSFAFFPSEMSLARLCVEDMFGPDCRAEHYTQERVACSAVRCTCTQTLQGRNVGRRTRNVRAGRWSGTHERNAEHAEC